MSTANWIWPKIIQCLSVPVNASAPVRHSLATCSSCWQPAYFRISILAHHRDRPYRTSSKMQRDWCDHHPISGSNWRRDRNKHWIRNNKYNHRRNHYQGKTCGISISLSKFITGNIQIISINSIILNWHNKRENNKNSEKIPTLLLYE